MFGKHRKVASVVGLFLNAGGDRATSDKGRNSSLRGPICSWLPACSVPLLVPQLGYRRCNEVISISDFGLLAVDNIKMSPTDVSGEPSMQTEENEHTEWEPQTITYRDCAAIDGRFSM